MFGQQQAILNYFQSKKANKELEGLLGRDPTYQKNPLAAQQFAMAQQLSNGRMTGAASQERNIFQNQANTINAINKNATDSSQALALAAGTQGQSNQAFANLRQEEGNNKLNMLQNLNQAYAGMVNEDDKVYQDQLRKYGNYAQIKGAQRMNKSNAINGIFNGINSDINQAIQVAGMAMGMPTAGAGGGGGSQQSFNIAQPNVDAQMYYLKHNTPLNSPFGG